MLATIFPMTQYAWNNFCQSIREIILNFCEVFTEYSARTKQKANNLILQHEAISDSFETVSAFTKSTDLFHWPSQNIHSMKRFLSDILVKTTWTHTEYRTNHVLLNICNYTVIYCTDTNKVENLNRWHVLLYFFFCCYSCLLSGVGEGGDIGLFVYSFTAIAVICCPSPAESM